MGNALSNEVHTNEQIMSQYNPASSSNVSPPPSSSSSSQPQVKQEDIYYSAKEGFIPIQAQKYLSSGELNPKYNPNAVVVQYSQLSNASIQQSDISGAKQYIYSDEAQVQSQPRVTPRGTVGVDTSGMQTFTAPPSYKESEVQGKEIKYQSIILPTQATGTDSLSSDLILVTPQNIYSKENIQGVSSEYQKASEFQKGRADITTLTNFNAFVEAPVAFGKFGYDIATKGFSQAGKNYYGNVQEIYARREIEQSLLKQKYGNLGGSLIYTAESVPAQYLLFKATGAVGKLGAINILSVPKVLSLSSKIAPSLSSAIIISSPVLSQLAYEKILGNPVTRFNKAISDKESFIGKVESITPEILLFGGLALDFLPKGKNIQIESSQLIQTLKQSDRIIIGEKPAIPVTQTKGGGLIIGEKSIPPTIKYVQTNTIKDTSSNIFILKDYAVSGETGRTIRIPSTKGGLNYMVSLESNNPFEGISNKAPKPSDIAKSNFNIKLGNVPEQYNYFGERVYTAGLVTGSKNTELGRALEKLASNKNILGARELATLPESTIITGGVGTGISTGKYKIKEITKFGSEVYPIKQTQTFNPKGTEKLIFEGINIYPIKKGIIKEIGQVGVSSFTKGEQTITIRDKLTGKQLEIKKEFKAVSNIPNIQTLTLGKTGKGIKISTEFQGGITRGYSIAGERVNIAKTSIALAKDQQIKGFYNILDINKLKKPVIVGKDYLITTSKVYGKPNILGKVRKLVQIEYKPSKSITGLTTKQISKQTLAKEIGYSTALKNVQEARTLNINKAIEIIPRTRTNQVARPQVITDKIINSQKLKQLYNINKGYSSFIDYINNQEVSYAGKNIQKSQSKLSGQLLTSSSLLSQRAKFNLDTSIRSRRSREEQRILVTPISSTDISSRITQTQKISTKTLQDQLIRQDTKQITDQITEQPKINIPFIKIPNIDITTEIISRPSPKQPTTRLPPPSFLFGSLAFDLDTGRPSRVFKGGKRLRRRTPSILAIGFRALGIEIRAPKTPSYEKTIFGKYSGLGFRPILGKKKRR